MVLESYDCPQNPQMEQPTSEEFTFPFSQELNPQSEEMLAFQNDNQNTYNLRNQREPMIDGIPPTLHPKPPNKRTNKNPVTTRAPYIGQKNQNQGNIPTILKNPIWATEKYNTVEDLKRTKANMSMFDMLQNFLIKGKQC